MYPIIFQYGPITISSYGLLLALGLALALYGIKKNATVLDFDAAFIENVVFYLILSGILGARFLYTFVEHAQEYLSQPYRFFYVWEGGLSFTGGLLAAIITAFLYCKKQQQSFLNLGDLVTPFLCLALAIGKIGCFLIGCCHGKVCTLPWAVRFTHPDTLAYPIGVPLHPSQLYESAMAFGLFLLLRWQLKKRRFVGEVFYLFVIGFTAMRSFLEFFRGDPGHIGSLTTAQFLSIPMCVIAVILYARAAKKAAP